MTAMHEPFNPAIVECLRVAYRRGRAIREAREAEAEAQTPTPEADLTFYDDKPLSEPAEGV